VIYPTANPEWGQPEKFEFPNLPGLHGHILHFCVPTEATEWQGGFVRPNNNGIPEIFATVGLQNAFLREPAE